MSIIGDNISEEICIDDQNNTIDLQQKEYVMHNIKTSDVGVQVNISNLKSTRSKKIQCKLSENSTKFKTVACSAIKVNLLESCNTKNLYVKENYCSVSESSDNSSETSDALALSSSIESENSFNLDFEYTNERFKKMAYEVTLHNISSNPKAYIGLNEEWYKCNLIKLISSHIELDERNIFITLMKIKLNDSFRRLGDMFGISESLVCRLFHKTLPTLSVFFKQFIYWPKKKLIKELLPIPFRYRYSSVQSIIDCLEIEIPKPSDPIKQALTWSEYKKCNTLKYLISSTPDGFISFISDGFNGRCTDVLIVEKSNFLNLVPENTSVMADRGFKCIDVLLNKINCVLIRPPSVSQNSKSTKDDVLETKRIASLRIHIERVIGRLREFETLKPHALINCQLLCNTDEIITIACGLINLQQPIIKQ